MDFFRGTPRSVELTDVYRKLNRENEERMLLQFSMPLTADNFKDAHNSIDLAVSAISDPKSSITSCDIEAEFEGMRLEIYDLADHKKQGKKPLVLLANCTLRKLIVSRPKKQVEIHEGDIHLSFNTTIPYVASLWKFGGDYFGKTVFVDFSEGQLVIPSAEPETEDEDEDQDELFDSKSAAANDDMPTMPAKQRKALEKAI
jgi:hypothetical protein